MKAISVGSREMKGIIPNKETYNAYRDGKTDWKTELRNKMKFITIPIEIFDRLVALDRERSTKI